MKIEKVKIEDLISPAYNPRDITPDEMEKLKTSIQEFGYVDPIIVNEHNNHIVGGNQRYEALKALEYTKVNVVYINETDPNREKALNIALNKISGEWDFGKLSEILDDMEMEGFDITLTGFDGLDDIDIDLDGDYEPDYDGEYIETEEDDFEVDDDIDVTVETGDIYQLGKHRLICGDATNQNDLQKLLTANNTQEQALIDCYITDPPYGVDYSAKNEMLNKLDGSHRLEKEIANDNINDYETFFTNLLNNIVPVLNDYNTFYIFMAGLELHNLRLALDNTGCKWGDYLIWVKNNHILGMKDYNAKHEFILYGWHNHHKFYGGFQTTILEFDKPQKNDLHPTMKPIPLISKIIQDGTLENMKILDTFGGSGSTLIACEQTNRQCYMMEIDPKYCQIIINRWEEYTGETAEKIN